MMRFGGFTSILLIGLSIAAVPVDGAVGDILWTFSPGAPVFASPTLGRDGTIYLSSNAATCTALIPTSGDPVVKWTYMADDWIDATVALAEDGTLYVGTYSSTLAALGCRMTMMTPGMSGQAGNPENPCLHRAGDKRGCVPRLKALVFPYHEIE